MSNSNLTNRLYQLIATKNQKIVITESDIKNQLSNYDLALLKQQMDLVNLNELAQLYQKNYQTLNQQQNYISNTVYQDLKTKLLSQIKIANELQKQYHCNYLLFNRKQALDHNPKPINAQLLKQALFKISQF